MTDKRNMNWSFFQIWNKSLEDREERVLKPRQNMWASELGGSYIDRYLKMKAVKPTNPPNPRSLRKFEAGNMMEWLITMVLRRAGILLDTQGWVSFQYKNPQLLEVTGKLDHLAGGKPDWNKTADEIEALELPPFFKKATDNIIEHLQEKYPDGLEETVLEIKSCSSFMYDSYDKNGPSDNHKLQAFHYIKSKGLPEAHIVYISKDDLRMLEFGVFNTEKFEEPYKKDIENMTEFIKGKIEPPKEPEVYFNPDTKNFSSNWKVAYSSYLTKLYGYKNQLEYDGTWKPRISAWNRVVKRVKEGKPLTENNKEKLADMEKHTGYTIEKLETAVKTKGGE